MPKELARVMTQYTALQGQVGPLLNDLATFTNNYIILRDAYCACMEELAEHLKELGVKSAGDPKAKVDPGVKRALKNVEKYGSLMEARRSEWDTAALKVAEMRKKALLLQKDVLAVIKAKSGFFTTSKSLPQLKTLSTNLVTFANDLQKATTLGQTAV